MANGNLDLTRGDSRLQGKLQDGALDGTVRIQEAGRPQAQLGYVNGLLHGPSILYHPNGQVSAQLPYTDGRLHGVAQYFAAEGWLQRKVSYRQGLMHGEASSYYPDGALAEVELYRDGVRDGLYQRFHGNGQTAHRSRYLNGKPLDEGQGFAEDGRPLDADGKPMSRLRWWWRRWNESAEA
ncbi:toxin-antitoxin system YwqK family antitoxin [Ectopseudomonas mendocina]|uniref:Toxin-antitoxin system YwqK family antitoxin n=1 Tax=Ectopseudomonas mendocina TaxID=300 RepID=A0A2R3QWE1_ECTME|nr:toxin-antitoxin system YwqK family antitoxin [Pseudomonas mendocina]AVO56064.1 toxin-antitoxin system YwqK family antitoxin [Pseudomonas mendocina]